MRAYSYLMVGVILIALILGAQLAGTPALGMSIQATVDIKPETLNLKSEGKWVTAHIQLPEEYDVSHIDISSIMLGSVPVDLMEPTHIGDHDLMVKFDRLTVIDYIWSIIYHMPSQISGKRWEVTLTITGEIFNDPIIPFAGSDTIRVLILP